MTLDQYLKRAKITEAQFAAQIGINQSSVHRMRYGAIVPRLATLKRIVEATKGRVTFKDFPPDPAPLPFAGRGASAA